MKVRSQIGLMHDRVLAVEDPVIRVRPLDPDASFVAGHDLSRTNDGLGLFSLDLEPGMRADEHIHQRALADAKPESITEQSAQPLIRERLKAPEINRQGVDAWTKRRRRRDRRRRRFRLDAAIRAPASKAMVADDIGFDRRDLDLVVFADQLARRVRPETAATRPSDTLLLRVCCHPSLGQLLRLGDLSGGH